MVAYQTPPTVSTGTASTAAQWNTYTRDNFESLAKPPILWAYQTATQSIPNNTFTTLSLPATNALRGFSLASGVFTPTLETATYLIIANVVFATNATGVRIVQLQSSGVAAHEVRQMASTVGDVTTVTCIGFMAANVNSTPLRVQVWQSSGGALNTSGSAFTEVMVIPATRT